MKKLLFLILCIYSNIGHSQFIVSIICVDSRSGGHQTISFDDQNEILIKPDPRDSNIFDTIVNKNQISFKSRTNEKIYETIVYRTTGKYVIWFKSGNLEMSYSGDCSRIYQNKF